MKIIYKRAFLDLSVAVYAFSAVILIWFLLRVGG